MKTKVLLLIALHSRGWLCQKLGFTHRILKKRMDNSSWRKSEIYLIEALFEENKHLL